MKILKTIRTLLASSVLLAPLTIGAPVYAGEIGTSGWQWPLGSSPSVASGGEFLGNGCGPNNTALGGYGFYAAGIFHIGVDMSAAVNTDVVAIGPGVIKDTVSDFGDDGNAVVIEHTAWDGTKFVALYGHLKNNITSGTVDANDFVGDVNTDHTHFGIHPGAYNTFPSAHLGVLSCSSHWTSGGAPTSTNGFVNPVQHLTNNPLVSPDTDNDGVNDPQDLCPTTPGPLSLDGCPVRNNDVFQASGVDGVGWRVSLGGNGSWQSLKDSGATTDTLLLGDFDNDGSEDDVFQATGISGVGWRVSLNGTGSWQTLRDSTVTKDTLLVGDFDSDGYNDDIFQASGISGVGWRVSLNGTGSWQFLRDSTTTKDTLLLGDFDDDGHKDDVFQASGVSGVGWRVSYGGTGGWQSLKDSTTTASSLMVGDFDADAFSDDIFQASGVAGVGWRVSMNGVGGWQQLKDSTTTVDTLFLGDFDNDGSEDDVFQASGVDGIGWRVSYGGTGGWQALKDSGATKNTLLIGDFN